MLRVIVHRVCDPGNIGRAIVPELPQPPANPLNAVGLSPLAAQLAARLGVFAVADGARRRFVVAVSGGVDSLMLLELLNELSTPPLLVLHVHHGLSPHADAWAERVASYCRQRQLAYRILRVEVDRTMPSREAAARAARHAAFESVLEPGDALLLAHHADDQAETVLLRLLRGSGLAGLVAMRERRPTHAVRDAVLWRPLLSVRRAELEAEARQRGLSWVDDESNADQRYDRNFLRHEILPRLATRWPAVVTVLSRTAQRLAGAESLLAEYLDADLAPRLRPGSADTGGRHQLDAASLAGLSSARQKALLRHWLAGIGAPLFTDAWLEQLARLAASRADAEGELRVGGWELHRYRGWLVAFPALPAVDSARVLSWSGRGELPLPLGCLRAGPAGSGLALNLPPDARLEVRFRQGGEQLACAGGHRPLKKALQEAGIPPWLRERVPLLYVDGTLAAVGDRLVATGFAGSSASAGRANAPAASATAVATLHLQWEPGIS